jgi:hypothetical protein
MKARLFVRVSRVEMAAQMKSRTGCGRIFPDTAFSLSILEFRAFHVYLPTKDGRCHVGISFKTSVPEDLMKGIAESAVLIK